MIKLWFMIGKLAARLDQMCCKHKFIIKTGKNRAWMECMRCCKKTVGVDFNVK